MKKPLRKALNGPIPGENFTSDTKNYPWHRPPEHKNMDKALEAMAKQIYKPESAIGILTFLKAGVPITAIVGMLVMSGVGKGKWTPDFGLLIAGPTAKMIELMAKGANVKYTLGIEDNEVPQTINFYKGLDKVSRATATRGIKSAEESTPEVIEEASAKGFMEPTPEEAEVPSKGFM